MPYMMNRFGKESVFRALCRYWFLVVLFSLVLASFVSAPLALLSAFAFTFLVPGLVFHRFFKMETCQLLAFIPTFSVLVSTQLVYFTSLLFGYSSATIAGTFVVWLLFYGVVEWRKPATITLRSLIRTAKRNRAILAILVLTFALSFAVLCRSVWFESDNGIVLTGSNWQDTPLHYEIIESINSGNFPPQMPYYSGERMTYHYFVDFHTAILEKVYGYLPQLLPFLNAVFIAVFALAIYSLARPNGKRAAAFSTILATFGWGFSYFGFFSALANGTFNIAQNYAYQYNGLFGLPPIFDNLLQQRPLLIGLPAFVLVLALLRNMDSKKGVVLAGIITGFVFPFHIVSFICCYLAYFAFLLLNIRSFKTHYFYFLISAVVALPFLFSGSASVPLVIAPLWYILFMKENPILFYFLNLGVPFLVSLVFIKKVDGIFLKLVCLFLFLIPNLVSITPNPWDMYKFFIFAWIPLAVLSGAALSKIKKSVAFVLLLLSILTSANVILYNLGTNYTAASWNEYELGMWVRENTPERSVFLTYYSIHCPPVMIGGRLRVASYVNWAYGHGVPWDDIKARCDDVDSAYTGNSDNLMQIVNAYNVSYIYVGADELRNFPGCAERFNVVEWLRPVYNGSLRIYEVVL